MSGRVLIDAEHTARTLLSRWKDMEGQSMAYGQQEQSSEAEYELMMELVTAEIMKTAIAINCEPR